MTNKEFLEYIINNADYPISLKTKNTVELDTAPEIKRGRYFTVGPTKGEVRCVCGKYHEDKFVAHAEFWYDGTVRGMFTIPVYDEVTLEQFMEELKIMIKFNISIL